MRRSAILALTFLGACASNEGPEAADSGVVRADAAVLRDGGTATGPAHFVFVAGGPSHGPGEHEYRAGALLLSGLLSELGHTSTVATGGWPADPSIFAQADAIVFLTDGNAGHPLAVGDRLDVLGGYLAGGKGFAAIHWAVHFPESHSAKILPLLGGHYSDPISVNPHWDARFTTLPAHELTRGVEPFELRDEWYYNLRFSAGAAPILQAVPPDDTRFTADAAAHPGRAETVAWTFDRSDGGRSFGFTGAHFHQSWGAEPFRRLVVNALLWIARREVPGDGAEVPLDPARLLENLDRK